jgi:hypothetical protein
MQSFYLVEVFAKQVPEKPQITIARRDLHKIAKSHFILPAKTLQLSARSYLSL